LPLRGLKRFLHVRDVLGIGGLQRERRRDRDLLILDRRIEVVEVGRTRELILDRLRDLRLQVARRCAGIGDGD
jgi:hypothetical protein